MLAKKGCVSLQELLSFSFAQRATELNFLFCCNVQRLDVGCQFPGQGLNLDHSGESAKS